MSGWRWVVGLVLIAHGIGHTLGLIPLFKENLVSGWNLRSWLLTDPLGETASKGISGVLFAAGTAVFILAGLGVLEWGIPHEWWRPLGFGGAVVSTVALTLFWNAFPSLFPNKVGALAVNVALLGGFIGLWHWPTDEMLGQTTQAISDHTQLIS